VTAGPVLDWVHGRPDRSAFSRVMGALAAVALKPPQERTTILVTTKASGLPPDPRTSA
jgi:hypothetical protein